MPNHVTNKLKIIGTDEQVAEVLYFISVDKKEQDQKVYGFGTIDFNKITPMPLWVYGSKPEVSGIQQKDEEKYGSENTCLEWARRNWGTKWNAYSQSDEISTGNTIYFDTAWNGVPGLIRKLAWIFPNVEFEYCYADEDFGHNVGEYTFKDAVVFANLPVGGSKEAYELAISIKEEQPDWLVFNAEIDNYEYKDDE
ncbi:hypothetical protein [Planococcus faecalis]|uniref:YubB ferredoxin-like domain-containing protein n=1 Tax=Planococcus faecalis TaxID=1598147 RepID=A0ABM6IT33_9BACL|nr:hypothetical protein [Planococcus faecalis]AQU79750.1 hypothetical protein AJGP001_10945 [Planococcus faecalis]OHX52054.1 hypothetical protein BB777_14075 [Planococcus faecalis]